MEKTKKSNVDTRITVKCESWWTNHAYPGLTAQCVIQTGGMCTIGLDAFVT